MRDLQNCKIVPVILPGAIKDNADFDSQVIDLQDFENCGYLEFIGILGETDVAMATLKVMESDEKTNDTTLGGSPSLVKDATTKPGASDSNKAFVFGLDLREPRKRYLQLQAKAGNGSAGTYLTATAIGIPGVSCSDAADRGLLFAEYA